MGDEQDPGCEAEIILSSLACACSLLSPIALSK